jgi:hypothetical protein
MSNAFFNSDSFDDKQFPGYWLYPAIANVYKDQLNFPKGYNASPRNNFTPKKELLYLRKLLLLQVPVLNCSVQE